MPDFSDTMVRRLAARADAQSSKKPILQGDLSSIALPDVLTFISMIRHTGRVVFRHGDSQRVILWSEGEVVFATSNYSQDSLGEFLVRNGKISEQQHKESLAKMTPGMRHGKLLVQMGFITPKDLWWGIRHQVLEIISSLFTWKEGIFAVFEKEGVEEEERITLNMSPSSIIMEGIRRIDESAMIQERIPNLNIIFRPVRGAAAMLVDLELTEHEIGLFEQIDGKKTVRELIRLVDFTEFEVLQIMYQLLSTRLIEEVVAEPLSVPTEVDDFSELLNVVDKYNLMFARLYAAVSDTAGPGRARDLYVNALRNAASNELWNGVTFDEKGRFSGKMAIGNISELSVEHRRTVLDDGLNTLLSSQLFEISPHLPPDR